MKKLILPSALLLALTGCGSGEPEPAPTVTVTETPEPVTETVTETPQSCLDALDAGDDVIDLLIQGLDLSSEAIYEASQLNAAGVDSVNSELDDLTPQIEDSAFDWGFFSESCREEL